MSRLSRRRFMRWMALQLASVVGGSAAAACARRQAPPPEATMPVFPTAGPLPDGSAATEPRMSPTSQAPTEAGAAEASENPAAPATIESQTHPDLVVARGQKPRRLVRQGLMALGGMERFVKSGADVIIKPNICVAYRGYEYAATTNPWVVGALVELAFEAGAKRVRVLDYPFDGSCEEAYMRSGIREQVEANGGEMEAISLFKFTPTDIPYGRDLKRCAIYEDILAADVVINVPIAKHHSLAGLTLGMKNLMGIIKDRPPMHQNLAQRLPDLASRVRPALTVIDAVRMLMANGPTGGSLADVKEMNTLILSPDIVAADSYAATLFGLQPEALGYLPAAEAMGLGRTALSQLRIEEVNTDA
jgi:uncharacterized protein (DUF362 family)